MHRDGCGLRNDVLTCDKQPFMMSFATFSLSRMWIVTNAADPDIELALSQDEDFMKIELIRYF